VQPPLHRNVCAPGLESALQSAHGTVMPATTSVGVHKNVTADCSLVSAVKFTGHDGCQ
jgi:hypothetical protein